MPQPKNKTAVEYDAQIVRANEASALLSNALFVEVLEKMEGNAITYLLDEKDSAKRDVLWHSVHAVRAVKQELQDIVDTGKMAANKKKAAGE
jgi:hypothetical protein